MVSVDYFFLWVFSWFMDCFEGNVCLVKDDLDFWLQEEAMWTDGLVEVDILRLAF